MERFKQPAADRGLDVTWADVALLATQIATSNLATHFGVTCCHSPADYMEIGLLSSTPMADFHRDCDQMCDRAGMWAKLARQYFGRYGVGDDLSGLHTLGFLATAMPHGKDLEQAA